jgi:hypothetical protein
VIEYKQMQQRKQTQQKQTWKGRTKAATRKVRELMVVGRALASTRHVVMAQIVPMRFCNLSCAYCNEYDKVSKPVPLPEMLRRIDHLAALGASIITVSGGEPLTHPELDAIIARIRHHGRVAGMITNGYLLVPERIQQLNRAGLDHMQISIDNIEPDEISKKSLKVLDKKLEFLSRHAEFHVNINSVVGGGIRNPQDALVIGNRALELGFTSTIGIIHDGDGQLKPLKDESITRWPGWQRKITPASTSFRKRSPMRSRTTGAAAPAHVFCTFARTGWCTIAHNSAVIREFRWRNTTKPTLSGST